MHIPLLKPIIRLALLILSVVVYALTILAAYGGRFNPDFFTIPAVLTLALPYFAIASLLITIAWFACGRWFGGALGVLAILASWGPVSTACPIASSKKASAGAPTFTLMTYNMIHGWDQEKRDTTGNRTIQYIIDSGVDIVVLQELVGPNSFELPGITEQQREMLASVYPYQAGTSSTDKKVYSKFPVTHENARDYIDVPFDKDRYSFFKVTVHGRTVTIVNTHLRSYFMSEQECDSIADISSVQDMKRSLNLIKGPVRQKLAAGFKKRKADSQILRDALDRIEGPLIVCGDFNDVPESYAYRLIRGDDFKDAYVETNFGPTITYNKHAFWFHLDQILYRGPLRALSVRKGSVKFSDHYPLVAEFEFDNKN